MAKKTNDESEGTLADLKKRAEQGSAFTVQTRALFPEAKTVAREDRRQSR
jgi:hypothetical protein